MGMAANGFCPPSAGLQRNQWCTFSFLPQQRFSPISRKVNNQRLYLPRIPAFVRCFNIEDLLNTRSKVICSSFVSLE